MQVSRHCKIVKDQIPMKTWNNISRVDKDCIDAEEKVEQSMEFERVAEYPVSANGSPGEGGLEKLLKNAVQESGRPEDGSDGTNSADGKINSAGRP